MAPNRPTSDEKRPYLASHHNLYFPVSKLSASGLNAITARFSSWAGGNNSRSISFTKYFPSAFEVCAMVFHFFNVPDAAAPQNQGAVPDHFERGRFPASYDWTALYDEANPSAKLDLFRRGGGDP